MVLQESTLDSNRTLDPSVCLGPQVGFSGVVLSGCTLGQVEVSVVTMVMVLSAEETETTKGLVLYLTYEGELED